MNIALQESPRSLMAKKPERKTVKIDADLWHLATTIAHAQGIDLSAYLSDKLRPIVSREYPKALDRLKELGEGEQQ